MLAFVLFAFVASITPGPTNILILSNSARYGLLAALPIVLGACGAAALLVFLVGTGVGRTLLTLPGMHTAMTTLGIVWLSWLAWKIYSSPAPSLHSNDERRLGLVGAAALQLVNPKTWMMALAVVSVFSAQGLEVRWLALAMFFVSLPCLASWAVLGAGSAKLLRSPRALQWLNRSLAVLLLASAWLSLIL